jgi:hypothetical protein
MNCFIQVVDGFYPHPDDIRKEALGLEYSEPENLVGWRTKPCQSPGIRRLIETKFRVRITSWERGATAVEVSNGVFFQAFARGPRAETVGVHFDEPPHWVMMLIYLTPHAPYDAGTSLWQHRATGLTSRPTPQDAVRLGTDLKKLLQLFENDSQKHNRWIEIDRIGNVYNRAVMFPGGLFHSASKHFGRQRSSGRLYQAFHFPIKR